ncbi:thioredoxin family protein [Aureliella helgolandensis]|uniref:Thioredoxin C-1 n=1 Tax=Aureliella helgolandensis TaxID=2527968 RepID=A0A518G8F2_9BACT|nr:thioredoxin family protein [Aureliella helgolandensis]QDV24866.1 Thioredoxin C-1 [Aureliella helgolandensis]
MPSQSLSRLTTIICVIGVFFIARSMLSPPGTPGAADLPRSVEQIPQGGAENPLTQAELENRVVDATDDNFRQLLSQASGPVLIDFHADWCGPCRIQGGILEEVASTLKAGKILKVDVDANPQLAGVFKVSSIPMLVLYRDGEFVKSIVGVASKDEVQTMLAVQ